MYSGGNTRALPRVGFPIRKSRDQRLVSISPGLIAAAHVLHRLLAPRHPPCALVLLISKNTLCCRYGVFKVHAGRRPAVREIPRTPLEAVLARSLKTQQRADYYIEVDVISRRTQSSDEDLEEIDINELGAYRDNCPGIPRKEVIQPQLPLRLPCYDFTPIINPTFDGCLPKRVSPPASGIADFRGVTGGVYKARERIHRDVADSRLLATPPSWRRVSASNPNRDRLFGIRSASRHRSPLYRPM